MSIKYIKTVRYNMNKFNNQKILRSYTIAGIIFVSITGTLAHFMYDWTGKNPVVGLFTAVNESTWEHMKLIYFPMLLFFIYVWIKLRKRAPETLPALLIATLIGTFIIPVLFYTYTGILGFMVTAINLAIYYISVLTAFILFYLMSVKAKLEEVNIILYFTFALFICMFFLFTYDPPKLGIFIDPTTVNETVIHAHPANW